MVGGFLPSPMLRDSDTLEPGVQGTVWLEQLPLDHQNFECWERQPGRQWVKGGRSKAQILVCRPPPHKGWDLNVLCPLDSDRSAHRQRQPSQCDSGSWAFFW